MSIVEYCRFCKDGEGEECSFGEIVDDFETYDIKGKQKGPAAKQLDSEGNIKLPAKKTAAKRKKIAAKAPKTTDSVVSDDFSIGRIFFCAGVLS